MKTKSGKTVILYVVNCYFKSDLLSINLGIKTYLNQAATAGYIRATPFAGPGQTWGDLRCRRDKNYAIGMVVKAEDQIGALLDAGHNMALVVAVNGPISSKQWSVLQPFATGSGCVKGYTIQRVGRMPASTWICCTP